MRDRGAIRCFDGDGTGLRDQGGSNQVRPLSRLVRRTNRQQHTGGITVPRPVEAAG